VSRSATRRASTNGRSSRIALAPVGNDSERSSFQLICGVCSRESAGTRAAATGRPSRNKGGVDRAGGRIDGSSVPLERAAVAGGGGASAIVRVWAVGGAVVGVSAGRSAVAMLRDAVSSARDEAGASRSAAGAELAGAAKGAEARSVSGAGADAVSSATRCHVSVPSASSTDAAAARP
jgi:hypothetical protein